MRLIRCLGSGAKSLIIGVEWNKTVSAQAFKNINNFVALEKTYQTTISLLV